MGRIKLIKSQIKRKVFSCLLKLPTESAVLMFCGRVFQSFGAL
uniref:Uncharacterized protein n=1 Tax=Anguilla anguilla TaxID=7936 RepID=A0A0E9W0P8_ANGAN